MAHSAEQLIPGGLGLVEGVVPGPLGAAEVAHHEAPRRRPVTRSARRLAGMIVLGLLGLMVVWMRLGIVGSHWWPIHWLEISGSFQRVTPEMVRGSLSPALGRGFFALDMVQLQNDLAELPWVASADLRRRWPDTLEVVVIEHQPVAYWRDSAVISQMGEIFPLQGQLLIQGLPRLFGPQGQNGQVLELWRQVQLELDRAGLICDAFHVTDREAVWFSLSNGLRVDVGREDVLHRVRRLVAAIPRLRGPYGELPLRIDLRYSNGMAVEWPQAPATTPESEQQATDATGEQQTQHG